jgi:short-subunit dehydrogenase
MMTNGRLAGHSVLVTGASSGIGLGIARKMAEEGAAVGIKYRSHQEPAEKLAAAIRAWGGKAVEADYVTGTTLFVDGGMALYPEFRDNG